MSAWRDQLRAELARRQTEELTRQRRTLETPQGVRVRIAGRELLNFCSNDYLGLANHPALRQSLQAGVDAWGVGSGASHLVCGHQAPHEQAEARLAQFVGAEAALLFSTGYMANLAIPAAFLGRDDLILEDRLNHASLIDAAMVTRASFARYPHLNARSASEHARSHDEGRVLLATDTVFSMDGDIAPVATLAQQAAELDGLALFDDAHGFGVLGGGRGTLAELGIKPGGFVLMVGTLGKALGVCGAFVAGDRELIDYLVQFGRSYIYTTALPPALALTICRAVDLLEQEPDHLQRLQANLAHFRQCAEAHRLNLLASRTPIQPLMVGNAGKALALSQALLDRGFLVGAIRPPTVPLGTARLRIALSAAHQPDQIEQLVVHLAELMGDGAVC